jgi:actin-related protein 8
MQDGDIEIEVVENTNGEDAATAVQPNGESNGQPSELAESTEQMGSVSELPPTNGDAPQAQAPPAESTTVAAETIAQPEDREIVYEASTAPLDAAIAASIGLCATEAKAKAAASTILLIGGSSSIKGLGAFLQERWVPVQCFCASADPI